LVFGLTVGLFGVLETALFVVSALLVEVADGWSP
jgi:hypothetical protein